MKNNLLLTVLQALRVPHTASFAEELFESHPYRHSLLGLSLLLRAYGVENVGMQLDDKSQLTRLQTPFVAQVADGLAVVTETGPGRKPPAAMPRLPYSWTAAPCRRNTTSPNWPESFEPKAGRPICLP